jgi:DNA-binding NarL/FixJ family response regulator
METSTAMMESSCMAALRILIADDHALVRRMLKALVQSHAEWCVCGEAANGRDAVDQARQLKPDIVLLDVSMPFMTGLEATPLIHREVPESDILIVTQHDSRELSQLAMQAGALGYVVKSEVARDLLPAIEAARNVHAREGRGNAQRPASTS